MHNFGKFVYLDVQKTGSTFISHFLELHSNISSLGLIKHGRISEKTDAFYFISSRDPISQYASLYRYGCEGKGRLYKNLETQSLSSLYSKDYSTFEPWLKFILQPNNGSFLGEGYNPSFAELFGFLSFRFLALSFSEPILTLNSVKSFTSLCDLYDTQKLHSYIVKQETLNSDLRYLIQNDLRNYITDVNAAISSLDTMKRINTTQTFDLEVGNDLKSLIYDKERFLYAKIYSGLN